MPLVVGCALLGAWYLLGVVAEGRSRSLGIAWFAVLFVGWVGLVAASTELSWVAFALFFLALHLLPKPFGLLAVAAGTAVVVTAQLRSPGSAAVEVIAMSSSASMSTPAARSFSSALWAALAALRVRVPRVPGLLVMPASMRQAVGP